MNLKKLVNFLDSPEDKKRSEEWFAKEAKKEEIQNGRFLKFEKHLENNDFDKLLFILIYEHSDEYREKCYHNGYEPYCNNKMSFLFDYVTNTGKEVKIKKLDSVFNNVIYEYRDYYFQMIWGQGMIHRIYNKEDMKLVLQV